MGKLEADGDDLRRQPDDATHKIDELMAACTGRGGMPFDVAYGLTDTDSEDLPRDLWRYLPSIIVKDSSGQYESINAVAARQLGLSPDSARGMTDGEFFSEQYATWSHRIEAEVMETAEPVLDRVERQVSFTDQDEAWVLISRFPRRDSHGSISGVTVITCEITVAEEQGKSALAELQSAGSAAFGDSPTPLETLGRSRRAVAGANDGMWDRDLTTDRLSVSERWKEMLGIEEDIEMFFDDLLEMIHPDDRERVKRINDEHLVGKTTQYECEFRIRHSDRSYRWIHSRGRVTRDTHEKPVFFSGSHTDITESVKAKEQLIDKERFIQRLVDTDRSMIFVKDASHEFTFVNRALAKFYGASKAEMLGKRDSDYSATAEQRERFLRSDLQALEGRTVAAVIEDIRGADGKTYWFHTTKVLFKVDGEPHVLGVAIDLTAWYEERQKTVQQREELSSIIRLTPIALHLKDRDGKYTHVNDAFLRKASMKSADDVIGKTVDQVFDKDVAEHVLKSDERIRAGEHEVHSISQVGSRRYEVTKLPRHDANGNIIGILGVSREIVTVPESAIQD